MQYNTQLANDAALQEAVSRLVQVKAEIGKVIGGQDDVVEGVLICMSALTRPHSTSA